MNEETKSKKFQQILEKARDDGRGYYDPESTSSLNKEREADAENIRKIVSSLNEFDIELKNFNDLKNEYQI